MNEIWKQKDVFWSILNFANKADKALKMKSVLSRMMGNHREDIFPVHGL